jgi:hypothetical protein
MTLFQYEVQRMMLSSVNVPNPLGKGVTHHAILI